VNVIRVVNGPGITLELRTGDPLPSQAYILVAELARTGEELAVLLPGNGDA
jgi:hypothetical protein